MTVTLKAGESFNLTTRKVERPATRNVIREHIAREMRKNDLRAVLFALHHMNEWK